MLLSRRGLEEGGRHCGMRTTWDTHTQATLTYLMVFLLPEPGELTHVLGFPGVHLPLSVPIHEPPEVLGQLEDVT